MMSKVIENAQEGIFIVSLSGEYIGHNKAFLKMFGFRDDVKPNITFEKCERFLIKRLIKR